MASDHHAAGRRRPTARLVARAENARPSNATTLSRPTIRVLLVAQNLIEVDAAGRRQRRWLESAGGQLNVAHCNSGRKCVAG